MCGCGPAAVLSPGPSPGPCRKRWPRGVRTYIFARPPGGAGALTLGERWPSLTVSAVPPVPAQPRSYLCCCTPTPPSAPGQHCPHSPSLWRPLHPWGRGMGQHGATCLRSHAPPNLSGCSRLAHILDVPWAWLGSDLRKHDDSLCGAMVTNFCHDCSVPKPACPWWGPAELTAGPGG